MRPPASFPAHANAAAALLLARPRWREPRQRRAAVSPPAPAGFFGIAPQTPMTERDAEYMAAGGISSVRCRSLWSSIAADRAGRLQLDRARRRSSRSPPAPASTSCPSSTGRPRWLAPKPTTLPIDKPPGAHGLDRIPQRRGQTLRAAGANSGREHAHRRRSTTNRAIPQLPIRTWQIWNEANFFYFA